MIDINAIKEALPHRYPMLLVDRVLEVSEDEIVALKNVTINEPFFNGHFPQYPVMPGVLIMEALAQTAGVLELSKEENKGKLVFYAGMDKVKFKKQVVPGDQLIMTAKFVKRRGTIAVVEAKAEVDGKLAASGTLTFAIGQYERGDFTMFRKILIANRGEIAVRIIRAARELGIDTVAVYSTADKEALHTLLADEAVCIGPAKSTDSYLNMNAVLSAAVLTGAEAIHPGFGFLSENSKFATMCEEVGIKFIGPSGAVMDLMGDKINARAQMIKAKVPVIPGSDGEVHTSEEALEVAEKIGYPVMLKASAGGGGKGIRKVEKAEDLVAAFESASSEAKAAFGNGAMYMERVIYPARHIEVQILADQQGHVVHLGERDCSLQRNNQKVLEESPSVAIGKTLRQQIGEAAVRAAESVGYENAGTIEFLLDEAKGEFYFMEMNTRVQVEHPVTEFVTGVDIVKEQIKIADGQELSFRQEDVEIRGHAIECRINAENPAFNFAPSPGKISNLYLPSGGVGLRVDSAVYPGYTIPPYYDSMIAKIIVHGENRFDALMKMQRALYELEIDGVVTNSSFQLDLISDPNVIAGDYDTAFLMEKFLPAYQEKK